MRRAWLLLALAGCDKQETNEQAQPAASPAGAQPPALPGNGSAASPAQLEERARASLRAIIPDPDKMRLANLRAGAAGSVCGNVEGKQPDGRSGVRPFVITPEGVAVVSSTEQVSIQDPEDPFPDFYIRWCASPAELARLQPSMVGGETLGIGAPPPEIPEVPPEIPADLPVAPAEVPKEAPAAQAKAEPPPRPPAPTADDSFFNAVARPGKDKDSQ